MSKVKVDHKELMKQAKHFQYIRFVIADVNGISKGKSTAKSAFGQLKSGMGLYNGKHFFHKICFVKGCRGIVFTHGVRMGRRAGGLKKFVWPVSQKP